MQTKKVLIVSESHLIKTFVSPTLSCLKNEHNVLFDCFIISPISNEDRLVHNRTFNHVVSNEYINGVLTEIRKIGILFSFFNLWKISRNLPQYDIIHIHYHHWYIAFIIKVLRRKCSKLIISFFGSDFNEVSTFQHFCNKRSIKFADIVTAITPEFVSNIFDRYDLEVKRKSSAILIPLMSSFSGLDEFLEQNDSISAKLSLGSIKKIITCAYNGAKIAQHQTIWTSIVDSNVNNEEYRIVFPMTYGHGRVESIKNLKELIAETSFNVTIIEDYLELQELRQLRRATDIFIHIQTRDQLAASMLEHLAAGSIAIIGRWLPYEILVEKGIYAVWINSPNELTDALNNVIFNFQYHKNRASNNRKIVLDMTGWDNIKIGWATVYNLNS
jgi:glycosyltransferase involved in cell wall biosynthesis